ncbi:MAG: zinc metallopeptidase [Coriobacteriales bacterium]|jgi:Zn-dependent membrane protease YugP|nr:zinc metallopeptidase [Coriobacteriales bacterium]
MAFSDLSYLWLIVITLVLGFGTQIFIKLTYKKWSRIPITSGLTGAQAARRMLDAYGLSNVAINMVKGKLTDHYDPRTNVVSLSEEVYNTQSVAATAIACHECGHAVQHAYNYAPARLRSTLVPVVNFAGNVWIVVLFAGIFLSMIGMIYLAIALYAAVILFQLVTLPVEFDASSRAMAYVKSYGFLPATETGGARSVLTSAALTYVAAALISVVQLVYLLGVARR